jgi:hypothetical protein
MAGVSLLTQYIIDNLKRLIDDKETPAKTKLAALEQLVVLRPTSRLGRQSVKKGQERKLLGALRARTENEQNVVDSALLGLTDDRT